MGKNPRKPVHVEALIQKHGVENPLIAFIKGIRAKNAKIQKDSGGGTRKHRRD